jgi:hypothetical protein
MPYPQFDRHKLHFRPLSQRQNRTSIIRDHIPVTQKPENTTAAFQKTVQETVNRVKSARSGGAPIMLAIGAHTIKNGMAPTLIRLMEEGWLTHVATNGAGIIHDWEFAYLGESSEQVKIYVDQGQFGIWEDTCKYINLALVVGAFEGKGYGESIGSMIEGEGVTIPSRAEIARVVDSDREKNVDRAAAALDLLGIITRFGLQSGRLAVDFPHKVYSVQAAAFRLGVPFTGHPMFGHDIIYTHPMNHGAAIGRTALRDFLTYAHTVNQLEEGVYLSVGSAVMSPMIFEKALSMSQNLQIQVNRHIDNHYILVVDLAESQWDWQAAGEPPEDDPAYYLRFCKTFSRMGGTMRYLSADNRDFLLALYQRLSNA